MSTTSKDIAHSVLKKPYAKGDTGQHGVQVILVFIGLLLAMFVSSVSETIAATALPTIVGDLNGVEIQQWVTTSYILASTITMPIYGRLGDSIGRKGLLLFGLVVYTLGKVICAIAPTMIVLIIGRVVSGIGGGGLIILTQAAVADITPPSTRGKYLGIMGAEFAMATVLGPVLGGWFLAISGWRLIFWFTVPIAAVAILFIILFYHVSYPHQKHLRFDVGGCIVMAIGVAALILAVSWGGSQFAWDSWQILCLFAVFLACAIAFVLIERKAKNAIMPMYLFKDRNFTICSIAGMLIYIGIMGSVNYLPTFFQIVDKMDPIWAGLMPTPLSIGMFVASTATGFIASKTGKYKWMLLVMAAGAAVSFALMGTLSESQPIILTLAIYAFGGLTIGTGTQILVLVVQNEFDHNIVGTATAANNFFRQIGSTLGASLVGTLFTTRLTADLAGHLPRADNISVASITPEAVDRLPESVQHVIAQGYTDALVPLFIYFVPLCVVSFVLLLFIKQNPLRKTIDIVKPGMGAANDGRAIAASATDADASSLPASASSDAGSRKDAGSPGDVNASMDDSANSISISRTQDES